MDRDDQSPLMRYGKDEMGDRYDCTSRNIFIAILILYLFYVFVVHPNNSNYNDGSQYYVDYPVSTGHRQYAYY
jgi:hypothetical protein